jgi:hypothetical protein
MEEFVMDPQGVGDVHGASFAPPYEYWRYSMDAKCRRNIAIDPCAVAGSAARMRDLHKMVTAGGRADTSSGWRKRSAT